MAKRETSRRRGFSFDVMPPRVLGRGSSVRAYDPRAALRARRLVIDALLQALIEGDVPAFKEILAAHLEVVEKETFYRDAGISRRTLFRMLGPDGNPTLENVARVVKAIAKPAA